MDKRTWLFFILSAAILLIWMTFQRPSTRPSSTATTGESAKTPAKAGSTPTSTPKSSDSVAETLKATAERVRRSPVTKIFTDSYEVEVAHATASLRSWRLTHYPMRDTKGRLQESEPSDLIPVYSGDYGGIGLNDPSLVWTPVDPNSPFQRALPAVSLEDETAMPTPSMFAPPPEISLSSPEETATIAFNARKGDVEIVKTFTFHGGNPEDKVKHVEDWRAYAVDVSLSFKNVGEARSDALAQGYQLRWGPGIAADREIFDPHKHGEMGALVSTTNVPGVTIIDDKNLTEPGPQTKDADADAIEGRKLIWTAMSSKNFVAALIPGELAPDSQVKRMVRFSEYDAFPLTVAPKEPERYGLLREIGKGWLLDDQHFGQRKTTHFLILPTGMTNLQQQIARLQGKDDHQFERVYAEYGSVAALLTGTQLEVSGFFLNPGEGRTDIYRLYVGPKNTQLLKDVQLPGDSGPAHLEEVIRFGNVTGGLAKALLWLLRQFYALLRNYGVSIILLTILVRLALYPITQKSSESMKKMQTRMKIIQPELDAAKQKFRDNPQAMNAETMKIYRKYGINPASQLGGCLMMAAQMPIFIAMYSMLGNAAELRGEPFFLWIDDLTAPDTLMALGGLPIRLLPLLMTTATLLQQIMNPATTSMAGSQRTMSYMMAGLFLVIFYNMPSGLNLYWGVSTFIGVGQQWLVNKYGKATGDENLTATDLEKMAKAKRKQKRQRGRGVTG